MRTPQMPQMPETDAEFFAWVRRQATFAAAIRSLRLQQCATRDEVAELAAIEGSYLYRLEGGDRHPERDVAIAVLLAGLSLPVLRANPLLVLAGYAPMHQRRWVRYHRLWVPQPQPGEDGQR